MIIKSIDREVCRALRTELDAALAAVAKRHGVVISLGNARFTASTIDFKLGVAIPSGDGPTPVSAEEVKGAAYLRASALAAEFGAKPEWLGTTFRHAGNEYRVAGLNPKKPKNCMMITRVSDGRRLVCNPAFIASALR